jgi:ubiquinone/menaquinone biosynthesis C-methylase UbiE
MELSPTLYRLFVRPKWFSNLFFSSTLGHSFDFNNKTVLDFGCGIGSSSFMFTPSKYIGVDCDCRRIDYARKLYPEYTFAELKNNTLPVPDHSVDYIVILSVLHHIPTEAVSEYLEEFKRVLKPSGRIIAVEPCLFKGSSFCNFCMSNFDKGRYIRDEDGYVGIFKNSQYDTDILKRYNQLIFYNKLFFTAVPEH